MFGLRVIRLCVVILFCSVWGASVADQAATPAMTTNLAQFKTNHIYLIMSREAQMTKVRGGYILVLEQVHPGILAFTPPPVRSNALIGVEDFINIWNSKRAFLNKSPPFGAIVFKSYKVIKDSGANSYILPLYSPVYDAAKNTLTFKVITTDNFDSLTGYHESVTLFIE